MIEINPVIINLLQGLLFDGLSNKICMLTGYCF